MRPPGNPRHQLHPATGDRPPAGRPGPITRIWRARTELLLLAALAMVALSLPAAARQGGWLPFVLVGGAVSVPATRTGRHWAVARLWCVISRHRLRRVCLETTMHTRAGRIPLVLWITPTATGEKALILTRAGISAEEFDAYREEIAAACWARAVRVHRHRTRAALVVVEIIRRDAVPGAFSPGLSRLYGRAWVATRPDLEEPPDPGRPPVPLRLG